MQGEIWRSPPPLGVLQRHSHEDGVVRAAQRADCHRDRRGGAHALKDAETGKDARRVRRQLKPRAELLERAGLLVKSDVESRCDSARAVARPPIPPPEM